MLRDARLIWITSHSGMISRNTNRIVVGNNSVLPLTQSGAFLRRRGAGVAPTGPRPSRVGGASMVASVNFARSRPYGPGRSGPARCSAGYPPRDARSSALYLRPAVGVLELGVADVLLERQLREQVGGRVDP